MFINKIPDRTAAKQVKDLSRINQRDFGADVVRIAAGIMVLWLHFFLRNGFYYQELAASINSMTNAADVSKLTVGLSVVTSNIAMIAAITIRTISFCAVPLFVMLSGYLKCTKEWSRRYYLSLVPILLSYTLISILHLFYRIYYLKETHTVDEWLLQFLGFKLAEYSWYVGMYIGLFLLIPLLNKVWLSCRTRKEHRGVVVTLAAVTFLPVTVNSFIDSDLNLLPAYFTGMYYIGYYFFGCYIRTYRPKVPKRFLWFLILFISILISVINILTRTESSNFYTGFHPGYSHLLTAFLTICVFLSLYQVKCQKEKIRFLAMKLSNLIFEIYLCSFMIDKIVYVQWKGEYPVSLYIPVGILMTAVVFAGSLVLGVFVTQLKRPMQKLIKSK